jgi:hypothetical protein
MDWLTKQLASIYWSLRHILEFWFPVLLRAALDAIRYLIVLVAIELVLYFVSYLLDRWGGLNVNLASYFPHAYVRVVIALGTAIFGYALLHEAARAFFILGRLANREYWRDVKITLKKYPADHALHGISIVIRNYKSFLMTELTASVIYAEQGGNPLSANVLPCNLPAIDDRKYAWGKTEVSGNGNTREFALTKYSENDEGSMFIPTPDSQPYERKAHVSFWHKEGSGLIRVQLDGKANDLPMRSKIVEIPILLKSGRFQTKTENQVVRRLVDRMQVFRWAVDKEWWLE